jgi:hypothetical protein
MDIGTITSPRDQPDVRVSSPPADCNEAAFPINGFRACPLITSSEEVRLIRANLCACLQSRSAARMASAQGYRSSSIRGTLRRNRSRPSSSIMLNGWPNTAPGTTHQARFLWGWCQNWILQIRRPPRFRRDAAGLRTFQHRPILTVLFVSVAAFFIRSVIMLCVRLAASSSGRFRRSLREA